MAIIPKNDSEVFGISVNRIRDICSSLETEIDAVGIKLTKSQELDWLIKGVKKIVKWHRKGRSEIGSLPQKTYESIFGNIRHWGDSAADRAIVAWNDHQAELEPFIKWANIKVLPEDIEEFVKLSSIGSTGSGGQTVSQIKNENSAQNAGVSNAAPLSKAEVRLSGASGCWTP